MIIVELYEVMVEDETNQDETQITKSTSQDANLTHLSMYSPIIPSPAMPEVKYSLPKFASEYLLKLVGIQIHLYYTSYTCP